MASTQIVKRKNGTVAHKVLWREDGRQRSMTFDDEARQQAQLLERFLTANGNNFAKAESAAASAIAAGPSLADVIEEHIAGLTGVEDRTRADYRRDARLHLIPQLGHLQAGTITRRQIRDWVNTAHADGAAPKSIANWHGLLSAVMATAVDEGLRADNPCKGVRLPERDRRNDHEVFMEPEEYAALLPELPATWRPLVEVLGGTGARWGEVTALQVNDLVHTAAVPYLRVNKAWKKDAQGRPFLSRPKTRRSVREVTISSTLAGTLLELAAQRSSGESFLLQSPSGRAVNYNYFQGRIWTPAVLRAVEKGGLRHRPKIHDLRHSHGSWLIAEGVDLLTVQRRLGHESITTTTNIYGHISQRTERAAADAIGRVLG